MVLNDLRPLITLGDMDGARGRIERLLTEPRGGMALVLLAHHLRANGELCRLPARLQQQITQLCIFQERG